MKLTSPGWFDRLSSDGWIEDMLNGDRAQRRQSVLSGLGNIAHNRPTEIIDLLNQWWSRDLERAKLLIEWFVYLHGQNQDRLLAEFCERFIRSDPPGLFDLRNARGADLTSWVRWRLRAGPQLVSRGSERHTTTLPLGCIIRSLGKWAINHGSGRL
jgi:hypothetical protein